MADRFIEFATGDGLLALLPMPSDGVAGAAEMRSQLTKRRASMMMGSDGGWKLYAVAA